MKGVSSEIFLKPSIDIRDAPRFQNCSTQSAHPWCQITFLVREVLSKMFCNLCALANHTPSFEEIYSTISLSAPKRPGLLMYHSEEQLSSSWVNPRSLLRKGYRTRVLHGRGSALGSRNS